MALTTLYNSTNHPLTWDKVNETLKAVDDNFTFVSSQAVTGVLQDLSQDITPNSVGTFDLGTPTQRWDNVYANNISVGSLIADVTGDLKGSVFADDSSIIVDATEGTLTGDLTGNVTGNLTGNVTGNLTGDVVATDIEIDGATSRLTFDSLTAPEIRNTDGTVRVVMFGEDYSPGTAQLYVEANDVWLYSDLLVEQNTIVKGDVTAQGTFVGNTQGTHTGGVVGNVLGNIDGDVTGSVYSEDSSGVLVDGLHGVLNTHKLDQIGAADGEALVWSASGDRWEPGVVAGGGGGTGLGSRTTKSGSTSIIADGDIGNTTITGAFSAYMVLKLQVDAASWVRIYTDVASRTADASRLEAVDPSPGAGVVVETITTGADTILISPAVIGFNNESPVTDVIPISVKNKSGTTQAITVTLTLIQLEA